MSDARLTLFQEIPRLIKVIDKKVLTTWEGRELTVSETNALRSYLDNDLGSEPHDSILRSLFERVASRYGELNDPYDFLKSMIARCVCAAEEIDANDVSVAELHYMLG